MAGSIIIDGAEKVAYPKCSHPFPLTEGISRQTIERYGEDFQRELAARRQASHSKRKPAGAPSVRWAPSSLKRRALPARR